MIITKSKIFKLTLGCFIFGISLGSFVFLDNFVILSLSLLCFFIFLSLSFKIRFLFLLFSLLLFGIWRFQISVVDLNDKSKIYSLSDQYVNFQAKVVEVDSRLDSQKITVEVIKDYVGQVLISTSLYPKYYVGQLLDVNCKLQRPEAFEGFDYEKYLARYDIYTLCYRPKIKVIGEDKNLKYYLFIIKDRLSKSINRSLTEPQASIIQAMVLANRRNIPSELLDKFSNVGISHVIAISGMHIAIISSLLISLIISLGVIRQTAFWLAVFSLFFYLTLIGFPASAVRATIMGGLVLYAQKIGRLNSSVNALLLAACIMLIINPKLLLSDIGFQLSFAATIGIIFISPIIKKHTFKLPALGQTKEILTMTLSAQITTLPLIVFYFKKLSLISFLANVLVLPVVPFILIGGIIVSLIGLIDSFLGRLFGFLVWIIINYLLIIVDFLNDLGGYYTL